jgi:hypothetical protein
LLLFNHRHYLLLMQVYKDRIFLVLLKFGGTLFPIHKHLLPEMILLKNGMDAFLYSENFGD